MGLRPPCNKFRPNPRPCGLASRDVEDVFPGGLEAHGLERTGALGGAGDLCELALVRGSDGGVERRVAHEDVPDLDEHLAGQCADDEVVGLALELLAVRPAVDGSLAEFHGLLGTFDEEALEVAPPVVAHGAAALALAALADARVEADVGDELAGGGEAADVADEGAEGKGVDRADAEHLHEQGGVGVAGHGALGALFVGGH